MSAIIKVDPEAYLSEVQRLEDALSSFESYTSSFSSVAKECVESNNSDFIDSFKALAANTTDISTIKLVEDLQCYAREIRALADTFTYSNGVGSGRTRLNLNMLADAI